MRKSFVVTSSALVTFLLAGLASGATPRLIPFQGHLTDAVGDPVADGGHLVKFIIYDAAVGGSELWNSGFNAVTTTNGLFTYELGSVAPLPDDLFTDSSRYLGITVGADPELTPRTRLLTGPYAYHSLRADSAGQAASVDWTNVSSIPAGFADNTDDELSDVDVLAIGDTAYATLDHTHDTSSIVQGVWNTPALEGTWVNYGSGYSDVAWFIDVNGVVHLRGLVRNGAVPSTIFTLPPEARPAARKLFIVYTDLTQAGLAGRVDVLTTGEVQVQAGTGGIIYLSLEGITFRATGF